MRLNTAVCVGTRGALSPRESQWRRDLGLGIRKSCCRFQREEVTHFPKVFLVLCMFEFASAASGTLVQTE